MDTLKSALKGQYHAGLFMLRECVEKCPEDLWIAGKHPRNTWRIAYHATFFTHLYLMPTRDDFQPWEHHIDDVPDLWEDANAPVRDPYTRAQLLAYIDHIDTLIDPTVDILDLESPNSGFHWYKTVGKLEHQLLNIRHLGIHTGQLEEILDRQGIDFGWVTTR